MVDAERCDPSHATHEIERRSRREPLCIVPDGGTVQETKKVKDVNLAGLAMLAFLILFLPGTGLIHRRARALAIRSKEREQKRALEALLLEEAMRALAKERSEDLHQAR
jgi:hypothetical protein